MPFDAENTKNSENFKSSTLIFVQLFFSFTISFLHLLSPPCSSYFIFCDLYFCSDTPDIKTKSVLAEILYSFVFFFAGFWIYEEGKPVICGNGTAARYGIY